MRDDKDHSEGGMSVDAISAPKEPEESVEGLFGTKFEDERAFCDPGTLSKTGAELLFTCSRSSAATKPVSHKSEEIAKAPAMDPPEQPGEAKSVCELDLFDGQDEEREESNQISLVPGSQTQRDLFLSQNSRLAKMSESGDTHDEGEGDMRHQDHDQTLPPYENPDHSFTGSSAVSKFSLTSAHVDSKSQPYWLSFFTSGVPYRLLLPHALICHVVGKGGKTVNQISQVTSASIQICREHPFGNLKSQIVLISGPSPEAQQAGLATMLKQLQSKTNQLLVDRDGLTPIVILVPEKAISLLIGAKGATINRIAKESGCDIQILPEGRSLTHQGRTDKAVSVRGTNLSYIVDGIAQIHKLLNDMYKKHKLIEADFIFSLRDSPQISYRASLSAQPLSSETSTPVGGSQSRVTVFPKLHSQSSRIQKRSGFIPEDSAPVPTQAPFSTGSDMMPRCFTNKAALLSHVVNNTHDVMTLKFLTSKTCAAWVIGNSGNRKRDIEAASSATVKILNHSTFGTLFDLVKDRQRVVVVKGSPVAIGIALNIIIAGTETTSDRTVSPLRLILSKTSSDPILSLTFLDSVNKETNTTISLSSSFKYGDRNEEFQYVEMLGNAEGKVTALMLVLQHLLETQQTVHSRSSTPFTMKLSSKRRRVTSRETSCIRHPSPKPSAKTESYARKKSTEEYAFQHVFVPPEAHFLKTAVSQTYPRVITASEVFTFELSFSGSELELLQNIQSDQVQEIVTMIQRRTGSKIAVCADADKRHKFTLSGTPLGNSTAILLFHETLLNLMSLQSQTPD